MFSTVAILPASVDPSEMYILFSKIFTSTIFAYKLELMNVKTHLGVQKLNRQTSEKLETRSSAAFGIFFTQKESKEANQNNEAMASKVAGNFSCCICKQVSTEFLKLLQSDLYCVQTKSELIETIYGKNKQPAQKYLLSSIFG